MKLQFWTIGKSHEPYVKEGIELFTKRITNYYPVEWHIIAMPKNAGTLSETELKKKEGEIGGTRTLRAPEIPRNLGLI